MKPIAQKRFLLTILMAFALFSYVDRIALGIALQDIKMDLQLSDTQLGLLTGIAFALFYSIMGIPIARWADRGDRITIISLAAFLWSGMVALCSVATSFMQLLLIRVGVAVGEAGCNPPAFSLISDHFDRHERPRAFAFYNMGGALSFVLGFFLAGWLNQLYGWRKMFLLIAMPGVLLAVMTRKTLRDPRHTEKTHARVRQPTLMEVAATLWRSRTFCHLLMCNSILYLFGYGILQWQPAFFMRSYGYTSVEIGTRLAVTYGVAGLLGTYLGGEWVTRRAAGKEARQLRAMSAAIFFGTVAAMFAYWLHNAVWAFTLIGCYVLLMYAVGVPLSATLPTLVPERMRAVSVAIVFLAANLIGMGLGPLLAGALSDGFRGWVGEESLRYALLALTPGYFWCAWHAWRASRAVGQDLLEAAGQYA